MNKKDKERVDKDVRPKGPWYSNYDYGGPEEASETGPGRGLYNGNMDKYDSVKDFIEKKRKQRKNVTASDQLFKAASYFELLVGESDTE